MARPGAERKTSGIDFTTISRSELAQLFAKRFVENSLLFQLQPGIKDGVAFGVEALLGDPLSLEIDPDKLQDPVLNDMTDELRRRIAVEHATGDDRA